METLWAQGSGILALPTELELGGDDTSLADAMQGVALDDRSRGIYWWLLRALSRAARVDPDDLYENDTDVSDEEEARQDDLEM